jgi:hypothetical protein
MTSSSAEREAQRQRQRALTIERARKFTLESIMKSELGRTFIWDELSHHGVYELSYVMGSFDGTAFKEGARNQGQRLLTEVLKWCPSEYLFMTRENSPVKLKEEPEEPSIAEDDEDE